MIRYLTMLMCIMTSYHTANAAEEETEAPEAQVYLLATTNQGGLQNIPMLSMKACQTAAEEIYEQDDSYAGPFIHVYCIGEDGRVWTFDD